MSDAIDSRLVHADDPDAEEITHIAVVQKYGLCVDGSVDSKGFSNVSDAVIWVRNEIEAAHGEVAYVWPSRLPIKYDLGGDPKGLAFPISWIMTPGGPTHGFVIDVTYTQGIES